MMERFLELFAGIVCRRHDNVVDCNNKHRQQSMVRTDAESRARAAERATAAQSSSAERAAEQSSRAEQQSRAEHVTCAVCRNV